MTCAWRQRSIIEHSEGGRRRRLFFVWFQDHSWSYHVAPCPNAPHRVVCCFVLCCAILCCVVLTWMYCVMVCCTILYWVVVCCVVHLFCWVMSYYTVLCLIVVFCVVWLSYCVVTLFHVVMYCRFVLCYVVLCNGSDDSSTLCTGQGWRHWGVSDPAWWRPAWGPAGSSQALQGCGQACHELI